MTRTVLDVFIESKAPLLLGGRKPAGVQSESIKYIPGRVLRGALAQTILRTTDHSHEVCTSGCDFCLLFQSDDRALFRNAYPSRGEHDWRPAPVTLLGCKINSEHGMFDSLCSILVANWTGGLFYPSCSVCNDRVEKKSGYIPRKRENVVKPLTGPQERELVRVGIDRARRCAAEEILYNMMVVEFAAEQPDSLDTKEVYRGSIQCPTHLSDSISQLLEKHVTHIGGAVSRGLGGVQVKVREKSQRTQPLREKCMQWNKHLAMLIESSAKSPIIERKGSWTEIATPQNLENLRNGKSGFFVLDLLSDAILPETVYADGKLLRTGRQSFVLTEDMLRFWSNCTTSCKLVASMATPATRSGWNSAWGTPREVSLLSKAGGVFVFWTDDLEAWLEPLERIEQSGLGEDVDHGFGEVEICSPVHINS